MLPLLLFWARCLSRTEFRETSCKEVGLSLLSAAPIECLMGFWLLLTVGSWWRPTVGLLRRIGFYEPFGLLTAIAVVEEAYLAFRQRRYFDSVPWRCAQCRNLHFDPPRLNFYLLNLCVEADHSCGDEICFFDFF